MKIIFFQNTKINESHAILNFQKLINPEDDTNLGVYLKSKNPDYDENNPDQGTQSINGISILRNSFFDNFKYFNLKNDYAAVFDYPFNPDKWTYFFINKIEYLSNFNHFKITLNIDLLNTFNILEVIDVNRKIAMYRGHLKDSSLFDNSVDYLKFKKEHPFKLMQPISQDVNFKNQKYLNKLINTKKEQIAINLGFEKWAIFAVAPDAFEHWQNAEYNNIIATKTNSTIPYENKIIQRGSTETLYVYVPYSDSEIKVKGGVNNTTLRFKRLYDYLKGNPLLYSIQLIDFPPFNYLEDREDTEGHYLYVPAIIIYDGPSSTDPALGIIAGSNFQDKDGNSIEMANQGIRREDLINYFAIENNFIFDYKKPTNEDDWIITDDQPLTNFLWNEKNEIIMQFSPFKNYEIGYFSESYNNYEIYSLNNQQTIDFNEIDRPFLNRYWLINSFATTSFASEIGDNIYYDDKIENENYFEGNYSTKENRALLYPTINNAWSNYNLQKEARAIDDFGQPIAAGLIGRLVFKKGGGLIGGGISLTNKIIKRQTIKHEPNEIKNNSIDIFSELIIGHNSFTISKNEIRDNQRESIAYDYFKKGIYLLNNYFHIRKILFNKERFNFLQISQEENIDIFNQNLIKIYRNDYLNILKNGVWYWIYKESLDLNDLRRLEIFNF